ncbi:hypothetical protein [Leuconostoc pseudomesenteroides]|jgi:hypothetical protein|uniref:hypothetical protein n=2 Tax=Lactobacillaceae TaxID=33958 RepID=UPI0011DD2991|nr:hypothetical protein [Leuconostoc pseudomesenteroides]MBS0957559.1 hypothetical protein [Leuconostoc pseudomesenteroides]MCT4413085.1 hypothetical protein [Leuconostoc pseudomesenteroides]WAM37877.1 hypothetical protein OYT93_06620 [Leuconostoc pseudomesenteroides]
MVRFENTDTSLLRHNKNEQQMLELHKNAEISLIKAHVISRTISEAKSQNSKIKSKQEKTVKGLITKSNNFKNEFKTTAKGKWVDNAVKLFDENKAKLNDI